MPMGIAASARRGSGRFRGTFMSDSGDSHAVLVGGPADGYCLGYAVDEVRISYPILKPLSVSLIDQMRRFADSTSVEAYIRSEKPSVDVANYRRRGTTQYFDFVGIDVL